MTADVPTGVRFGPTEQLKMKFLRCKAMGVWSPGHKFIGTCDLYGEQEPWEIFGDSEEPELYFFTWLKKLGKKKMGCGDYKRFSRNVGRGTWSNKGKSDPIYQNQRVIGFKKCLRYERKKGGKEDDSGNGTWLLKEYSLPENLDGVKQEYKDCVLCVLKRKGDRLLYQDGPGLFQDPMPALVPMIQDHQEAAIQENLPITDDGGDVPEQEWTDKDVENVMDLMDQDQVAGLGLLQNPIQQEDQDPEVAVQEKLPQEWADKDIDEICAVIDF